MSKFNTTKVRSAVGSSSLTTESVPSGSTYEGGLGFARDTKSELFLLAISNFVGENTFYESADERDRRFRELVWKVAKEDVTWLANFLQWLRNDGNLRSASLVAAAEAVKARLDAGLHGSNRRLISVVLQRADEPGEMIAYWMSRYGRIIPKPVKRGVADAAKRLYTERSLLKYDTASHSVRFGDVLDLTHPAPTAPWQSDLFKFSLDRRHNHVDAIPPSLSMIDFNINLRASANLDPSVMLNPERLRNAGMTWEDALSLVGSKVDKKKLWEAMIPSMGYMALLRNLRNFDEAGVSDSVANDVSAILADPEKVERSRQFPFRFLAAYRNTNSLRWSWPLEQALNHSLVNVPELPGRTLVLVDRSGSMFWGSHSKNSELTFADSAAIFGSAIALKNTNRVDLVQYGTTSSYIDVARGSSLLRTLSKFGDMGGTDTRSALKMHFQNHDRVILITDEQAFYGHPGSVIPESVPLYTFNLVGYKYGNERSDVNRITIGGGLTDAAFRLIPLLEAGKTGRWPWDE